MKRSVASDEKSLKKKKVAFGEEDGHAAQEDKRADAAKAAHREKSMTGEDSEEEGEEDAPVDTNTCHYIQPHTMMNQNGRQWT